MARLPAASLLILIFAAVISSKPFSSSQLQPKDGISSTNLTQIFSDDVYRHALLEVETLPGRTETLRKELGARNSHVATNHDLAVSDTHSLAPRQTPGEIFAEIARVMHDPFHDVYSFAISGGVSLSLIFFIGKFINAIRNTYIKQAPQSKFDMKLGGLKASFRRPTSEPIPWNSVENVFRDLARNVERGFIGLARVVLRRDDIETAADITVADQGIFFVLSMGTVLLLFWRIHD